MYPYNTYNESIHGTSKTLHQLLFPFSIFCFSPVSSDTYINAYTRICEVYISRNTLLIHNYTKRYSEIRDRACYSFIYIFLFFFFILFLFFPYRNLHLPMVRRHATDKKKRNKNKRKYIYICIYIHIMYTYIIYIYILYIH